MIVPNMNSKELLIEVFKDLEVVNRKATYLTQGLRREAVKSKTKYVQRVFDYKSMRHNYWFIVVDYLVSEPSFTIVVYYRDQYGLNGILVDGTHQALIHFTPHFLDRYNERFLKQKGVSKVELLKRFVPTNSLQVIKAEQKSETIRIRSSEDLKKVLDWDTWKYFMVRVRKFTILKLSFQTKWYLNTSLRISIILEFIMRNTGRRLI